MAQITYTNKVALNENPEIANINKVTDDDMNEIKQVVNDNYNNTIQITNTEPTDSDNKIWIDTGEIAQQVSEITNEYSTSTGLGYSANYVNNNVGVVDSGSNENGNYIKYADGTMICYGTIELASTSFSSWGSIYGGNFTINQPFAQSFIANPILNITPVNIGAIYESSSNATMITKFSLMRPTNTTSAFYGIYIAIGKWK